MKRSTLVTVGLVLLLAIIAVPIRAQIPRTMSYQGVLLDSQEDPVDGSTSLTFTLYDAATQGTALWTETQTVTVTNGLFNTILGNDTPIDVTFDTPLWLGIQVSGETEMSPRIELTASAYAFNSMGVAGSKNIFPSMGSVGIDTTAPAAKLHIAGTPGVDGIMFPDGTLQTTAAEGTSTPVYGPGPLTFGTTDSTQLRLAVKGETALQIIPSARTANLIGGYGDNTISPGVEGAVICGGGHSDPDLEGVPYYHYVSGNYAFIGGGWMNYAGKESVVCGGVNNSAEERGVVAGGAANGAGENAAVGGGRGNSASGDGAVIPGGTNNSAGGRNSFAAGSEASADHDGTFVWSDGTQPFSAAGSYQFLIQATNGVGIDTDDPMAKLDVNGTIRATSFIRSTSGGFIFPDGTVQTTSAVGAAERHSLDASDGNPENALYVNEYGKVGIGTTTPSYRLEVVDTAISSDTSAILGVHDLMSDYGTGVEGRGGYTGVRGIVTGGEPPNSRPHYGVDGSSTYAYGYNHGVRGYAKGQDAMGNYGVLGEAEDEMSGDCYGVYGEASGGGTNYGLYGTASGAGTNYAVYADGDLAYMGSLIGPPSDIRLKRNLHAMDTTLDKIMALEAKTYRYETGPGFEHLHLSEGVHHGFVAQELELIFPELVKDVVQPAPEGSGETAAAEPETYKSVNTIELIPLLVRAIQEQQKTIEDLRMRLEILENR